MKTKRTILAVAIAFALAAMSACSSLPQRVEIAVPVPCVVTVPPPPDWATSKLTDTSTRFEQVRALLAEREQARGYIGELLAAAGACR